MFLFFKFFFGQVSHVTLTIIFGQFLPSQLELDCNKNKAQSPQVVCWLIFFSWLNNCSKKNSPLTTFYWQHSIDNNTRTIFWWQHFTGNSLLTLLHQQHSTDNKTVGVRPKMTDDDDERYNFVCMTIHFCIKEFHGILYYVL